MNIQEQFNLIAAEYDANRRRFIPCFEDYYIQTTKLLLAGEGSPKRVLDLGAGTGLLSYYWYLESPGSEYVLIDIADEMLAVSRRRFDGIATVTHRVMDYTRELPTEDFDAVISALSIHHLEDGAKQALFARVYEKLPAGGLFVNYDQFCGGSERTDRWFDAFWESQLYSSGLTERDIELWKERRLLDRECSAEREIQMLRDCGFSEVKCVYACHKFAVLAAVK